LLIHRYGYQPIAWTYDPPNGSDETDISGVVIPLDRIDPTSTGSLAGRLLLDGVPAAGIPVTAGRVGPGKSGVGQPGALGVTDDQGEYLIEGLWPGVHLIQAGFIPRSGVVYPNQPGNVGREVVAGETTQVDDLIVMHEVALYTPASAGWYASTEIIFPMTWSEVPGATRYLVSVNRGIIAETTSNRLDSVEDFTLSDGGHVWSVAAYDDDLNLVGQARTQSRFYINTPLD
jgi:hypothetical protein